MKRKDMVTIYYDKVRNGVYRYQALLRFYSPQDIRSEKYCVKIGKYNLSRWKVYIRNNAVWLDDGKVKMKVYNIE